MTKSKGILMMLPGTPRHSNLCKRVWKRLLCRLGDDEEERIGLEERIQDDGFRVYALSSSLYLLFVSVIYLHSCVFIPMLIEIMFTYICHLYSTCLIKMMRLEQT